jgi:GDP-L-fucose synthase
MNKDRILITGGTGLVGFQLQKILPDAIFVGSSIDLRDSITTNMLFEKIKPNKVIHCAGKVGGLGGNMNYKGEFFYDNVMINTNVIEACRKNNVNKLVSFLSTCIFPDDVEYPLTEAKIHLGKPHNSNYPYAYAKRMIDIQQRAYREQYGLEYISVIPTNIYGPNDNFDLNNGHVIPSLIHKCYLAKQKNEDFRIWGTGKPLREFIHSCDISKLTYWALENYTEKEPIIFSNSNEVSIGYVAELIAEQFDYKDRIIFESDKPDGQFRKPSDNSKLKKYLPDFEFTPINTGIKDTVNWFIENYEKARK